MDPTQDDLTIGRAMQNSILKKITSMNNFVMPTVDNDKPDNHLAPQTARNKFLQDFAQYNKNDENQFKPFTQRGG